MIDNLIQRDPITNLPVFHSSSLKGALREELESRNFQHVKDIFGSKPKDSRENTSPGKARFFEARLLSVPVRSDRAAYLMVTSPAIIREFIDQVSMLGCKVPEQCITHLESVLQNELVNTFKDYKDPQALTEEKKIRGCMPRRTFTKSKIYQSYWFERNGEAFR
ncbi:MAG: RAMP superfamily CRISPR-associated protein [Tannerellaceae bacterium]|nr:RAMP superfamily CRISPR-associated protein [Tannerellaceae bacterium]